MTEKRATYVKVSILEAMERVLPQFDPNSRTAKRTILTAKLKEKPGFYGVSLMGYDAIPGGVILEVDMDEYLTVYKQMIQNDNAILEHVGKFPSEYLLWVEDNLRGTQENKPLDLENNSEHRTHLIRCFFGHYYDRAYIRTGFDTEVFSAENFNETGKVKSPIIDWIKGTLLEGYKCHHYFLDFVKKQIANGEDSLANYPDVESVDELETSIGLNLTHPETELNAWFRTYGFPVPKEDSPHAFDLRFSICGYSNKSVFPSGEKDLDMKRFNELERLLNTIRDHPNVKFVGYQPGHNVLIHPTYQRTQTGGK